MRRHMSHKYSELRSSLKKPENSGYEIEFPSIQSCAVFSREVSAVHPFTCMVVGMTGSGKTVWIQSLLQQAQNILEPPLERIIWCYSQWQPTYSESLNTVLMYNLLRVSMKIWDNIPFLMTTYAT